MILFRRGFYLILGFTFPGFWAFHATGYWAFIYQPVQRFFNIDSTGWLSFASACTLYILAAVIFEFFYQLIKHNRPEI